MAMYLFKCVYLVDETMFRNPLAVLETILHFSKTKKIIDNYYNIEYVDLVDGKHFGDKDNKYIKIKGLMEDLNRRIRNNKKILFAHIIEKILVQVDSAK